MYNCRGVCGGDCNIENKFRLVILAGVLLLIGVILPVLMVIEVLESTLFLNFVAAGSSSAGLMTGLVGISQNMRGRR